MPTSQEIIAARKTIKGLAHSSVTDSKLIKAADDYKLGHFLCSCRDILTELQPLLDKQSKIHPILKELKQSYTQEAKAEETIAASNLMWRLIQLTKYFYYATEQTVRETSLQLYKFTTEIDITSKEQVELLVEFTTWFKAYKLRCFRGKIHLQPQVDTLLTAKTGYSLSDTINLNALSAEILYYRIQLYLIDHPAQNAQSAAAVAGDGAKHDAKDTKTISETSSQSAAEQSGDAVSAVAAVIAPQSYSSPLNDAKSAPSKAEFHKKIAYLNEQWEALAKFNPGAAPAPATAASPPKL